jgi:allantoin racemase
MTDYVCKDLLPTTEVQPRKILHGPASIECEYDEILAVPEVVFLCQEAEREGFDAVFIDCFGEPGLRAARECVRIPVFGGFEPAIFYALGVADKIGIVSVVKNVVPLIQGMIAREGLQDRIAPVRYVDIPVLNLNDRKKLIAGLVRESKKAVDEDGAGVIVLGCTAMIDVKEEVEKQLKKDKYHVQVIEAASAALVMLETYVRMGLRHSEITYMHPPVKERYWWDGIGITEIPELKNRVDITNPDDCGADDQCDSDSEEKI